MSILLGTIFILSAFLLFTNTILYAILALQILIASVSIMLLEYGISNFFPLIYIMIYVGAIFVLFLFIIMLLHNEETKQGLVNENKILFLIIEFFAIGIMLLICLNNKHFNTIEQKENINVTEEVYNIGFAIINDKNNLLLLFLLLLLGTIVPIIMYTFIEKEKL